MEDQPLLEVHNVSKSFRGLLAVKDLSFSISEGQILGLIGPNGAGKTSAFNLIAGVYKPDSGYIKMSGDVISGKKPSSISRMGIARTFQIAKPFSRMRTIDNVLVGSLFGRDHSLSVGSAKIFAIEALEEVGLESKSDVMAGELTLADQRRLELARAIAAKPRLLMLDELMAGLNSTEVVQTLELLRKIKQKKKLTLLIIEHVMLAVTRLCEYIVVMNHGEKLVEGTPSEIVNDARVVEAYMGKKKLKSASEQSQSSEESKE